MSAQNKVAAGGGSNRKNKKKRKGRSQQKEEDEKKVVDCASKASGLCTGCDDIHQDEVKIEKVMQPVAANMSSGSGTVTRNVNPGIQTSIEQVPSLDTEHCLLCHKPRHLTSQIKASEDQSPLTLWLCPECRMSIEIRQQKKEPVETPEATATTAAGVTENRDVVMPDVLTVSNGLYREIETLMPRDKETTAMQLKWMELRHAIRCAYRQAGTSLADDRGGCSLGSSVDKLQESVKFFCIHDPHQLYERVEIQAREYILEVKLRLTEQLSQGTSSPQSGRDFLRMLTDEYWSLCIAMETLVDILSPLESDYLRKTDITVELLNKHLFYDLVFTNAAINDAMRGALTLSGHCDSNSSDSMLQQRYSHFEDEMYRADIEWTKIEDLKFDHEKDKTAMQHLTENELRKDEEIDVGNKPVSSSKELSLMERRFKSKSANRGKQDECGPLYLDDLDPKEKAIGRDILDPDCPGSPPSFEEHFTFMWDLYLERERYENDQSFEFKLASRVALDPDESNPVVKLSMTSKLNALSRIQRRELADDVLRHVLSRKTTLLEDNSRPRSVASDAFVYTGPVRQFVGCVDATECRCPSCAQTRCKCERCREARKSIEHLPSTAISSRSKSGKSSKSHRKKGKGGSGSANQSGTSTVSKGGCTQDGLSLVNGMSHFWDVKNRDSALALDNKLPLRSPCHCPACQMAREKCQQQLLDAPLSETLNRISHSAETPSAAPSGDSGSTEMGLYTPPVSPTVSAPPSSPYPSCSDQLSSSQSGDVRSGSPLPPLESQSDETSSMSSLGHDLSYGSSGCETKVLDPSLNLNSSSTASRSGGKHCNCYYCELFGHGQGITAPTSHNFTQVRDKLRQRLSQRKPSGPDIHEQDEDINEDRRDIDEDSRPVEELVSFITGGDKQDYKRQVKVDKKLRQKQKKAESKNKQGASLKKKQAVDDSISDHDSHTQKSLRDAKQLIWDTTTAALVNHVNSPAPCDGYSWAGLDPVYLTEADKPTNSYVLPQKSKMSNGSVVKSHDEESSKLHPKRTLNDKVPTDGARDEDEDSVDEFEKELEEFRRFCFDSAPQPKKKLSVNLDSLSLKKGSLKQ